MDATVLGSRGVRGIRSLVGVYNLLLLGSTHRYEEETVSACVKDAVGAHKPDGLFSCFVKKSSAAPVATGAPHTQSAGSNTPRPRCLGDGGSAHAPSIHQQGSLECETRRTLPVRDVIQSRGGFTLVELIVVIVILGILLAIAIPALTGYIDKAQDKQYIVDARNSIAAVRSVLDDAYAKGELTSSPAHPVISHYVQNGEGWATKMFDVFDISTYATGAQYSYFQNASALMGTSFKVSPSNPGWWIYHPVGSQDSTAMDADGFLYGMLPDGKKPGAPSIVVTYRMQRVDAVTTSSDIALAMYSADLYRADAGYEIYHCVV